MPSTPVNYTHTLGASVTEATYEAVTQVASRQGLSRSAFIRHVLEQASARGEGVQAESVALPLSHAAEAR